MVAITRAASRAIAMVIAAQKRARAYIEGLRQAARVGVRHQLVLDKESAVPE